MTRMMLKPFHKHAFATGFLALALLSMVSSPRLLGQSAATGALTGTVKDSSGAVVPNVTVTATSVGTDQARTSATDASGTYKFAFLSPGAYKLKFEAAGFNTAEVPSVTITVTETDVLDETLQVGAQTQQVEVHAETEQVQTASSTVGTTVAGDTLSNIPLTTRNYTTVLGLAAGANVGVYNATQLGRGTQDIVVNGAGAAQNNYQQDGASMINTAGTGTGADSGFATTGVGIVNPDSIQEFKIQTSTYDAGYGRNAGANVNVVTKSGTNQFHGAGFEFFRNTILNANDFFRKISPPVNGVPNDGRQVLNQNQFGGTLGGPVKKDKLFFFASYQRTWQKNGVAPAGYSVPTLVGIPQGARNTAAFQAALGAAFCPGGSATAGTTGKTIQGGTQVACNGSNINQVALNILNLKNADGSYYIPGSSTGVNQNVTFSIPAHYFENQGIGNFDYVINGRNTIAGRYFYSSTETDAPIGCASSATTASLCLPGAAGTNIFPTAYVVGKITSILSSNVVNEARISLQRSVVHNLNGFDNSNGSPVSDTQLGITPVLSTVDLADKFVISGLLQFGAGINPADKWNTSWEAADQISWSYGKHTIRAGFEYERDRENWHFKGLSGSVDAALTFTTVQDFLLGLQGCSSSLTAAQCTATQASSTSAPLPGQTNGTFFSNIANGGTVASLTEPNGDIHYYRAPAADAFVQDDFKVSSRLTLNLGLRWEYNGLLYDADGNTTNVWPNLVKTVNVPVAQGGTLGSSVATGSLAGFVVPSNYNPSLYPAPTVGGIFQNNKKVPTQNAPTKDAFAPRAGFAWRPLSTDRFVVRGGAGYFYDRMGIGALNSSSVQIAPYAVPVFQSGTANYAATEALPYQPASLGWSPRWISINTANGTGTSSNLNVVVMAPQWVVPTTYQWNLNTQYEFLPQWVLEVGYIGSHSIRQLGVASADSGSTANTLQLNEPLLATAGNPVNGVTTNTSSNAVLRVPYLGFSALGMPELVDSGKTLSDSLQITVRKQMSYGLEMQAAYTWASVLTTVDHNPYGDPNVQHYGPSSFYRPQRLTISYGWNLPFGHHDGFVGKIADGWNLSGVTVAQDGLPLTIVDTRGGAVYGYNGSVQQSTVQFAAGMSAANVATAGGVESRLTQLGGLGYFNKAAFTTIPAVGAINGVGGATGWGNSGVGITLGPGQFNFDATIQKTTKVGGIHEDASLVFRTEFFNVFNHPQFSTPTGSQLDFSNTQFGQITTSSVNPRLIQFALKYVF
jgi:hypothetical protein